MRLSWQPLHGARGGKVGPDPTELTESILSRASCQGSSATDACLHAVRINGRLEVDVIRHLSPPSKNFFVHVDGHERAVDP